VSITAQWVYPKKIDIDEKLKLIAKIIAVRHNDRVAFLMYHFYKLCWDRSKRQMNRHLYNAISDMRK